MVPRFIKIEKGLPLWGEKAVRQQRKGYVLKIHINFKVL